MEIDGNALRVPPGPGRADLMAALAALALPSVRLHHAGYCDDDEPGTRLGGVPLVGPDLVWPRTDAGAPLAFIGQLHGDEINATLGEPALPPGTLLAFFYEAGDQQGWGFDPDDRQYWRVMATPAGAARALPPPAGTPMFTGIAVRAERVVTVPDRWDPSVQPLREPDPEGFDEVYERLHVRVEPPCHRVLGWPEPVQNAMQLECQLASNGIYVGGPEGYRNPRAEPLRAGAADWVLVWQVDTDEGAGWMWGDVGTIYFWLRRQDLAAGDVDRVWMVFQCA